MDIPHSRNLSLNFFKNYIYENKENLKGKKVYDLSTGSGYIINMFKSNGSEVFLFDLFPEQNKFCDTICSKIDLQNNFPIDDNMADIIISSETIEHLPNQLFFFKEVSRILKPNGILLLTTPNTSSLRSRMSQFVAESEHYNSPLPNENNLFTKWDKEESGYFSKLFISGILRLRTLAAFNNLKIKKIYKTKFSSSSFFLMIFYPIILFISKKQYKNELKEQPLNQSTLKEIYNINTSLNVLLSKHLIIEFVKN